MDEYTVEGGSEEGPCVMNVFKQNQNRIYIGVTIAAIVLAAILAVNYGVNRKAEEEESTRTVTTIEEKEKRDKVLISTNTAVIKDGLSNMVEDSQMLEIVSRDLTVEEKAKILIDRANEQGGRDNISVILAKYE